MNKTHLQQWAESKIAVGGKRGAFHFRNQSPARSDICSIVSGLHETLASPAVQALCMTITSIVLLYSFTGNIICFIPGQLKYEKYICVPVSLHLKPPASDYRIFIGKPIFTLAPLIG